MAFVDVLIHTCTIQEDTGVVNADSGRVTPSWTDLSTSNPCLWEGRVSTGEGNERTDNKKEIIGDSIIHLGPTAVIATTNRVTDIVNNLDSVTVDAGPFTVMLVTPVFTPSDGTLHHIECELKRVHSG